MAFTPSGIVPVVVLRGEMFRQGGRGSRKTGSSDWEEGIGALWQIKACILANFAADKTGFVFFEGCSSLFANQEARKTFEQKLHDIFGDFKLHSRLTQKPPGRTQIAGIQKTLRWASSVIKNIPALFILTRNNIFFKQKIQIPTSFEQKYVYMLNRMEQKEHAVLRPQLTRRCRFKGPYDSRDQANDVLAVFSDIHMFLRIISSLLTRCADRKEDNFHGVADTDMQAELGYTVKYLLDANLEPDTEKCANEYYRMLGRPERQIE